MQQKQIKVLFDNSVLKDNLINLFEQNHILELKNNRLLSFYVSDMTFHENIIDLSYIASKKDFYNRIVNFLFKYSDYNFFKGVDNIILYELSNENFEDNYYLYSKEQITTFFNDFKNNYANWDSIKEIHRNKIKSNSEIYEESIKILVEEENEIKNLKSNVQINNYIEKFVTKDLFLKEHSSKILNELKVLPSKERLIKFLNYKMDSMVIGQFIIKYKTIFKNIIKLYLQDTYLKKYMEIYKYYLTFHYEDRTKCFDKSFNDNEYICCMKNLDILLANDSHYMKHCFEDIYKNTNKKILNPDDFIEYLKDIKYIK